MPGCLKGTGGTPAFSGHPRHTGWAISKINRQKGRHTPPWLDSQDQAEATNGGKADVKAYAQSLPVFKQGNNYYIEVINPVEYASYVEFGHRTPGGKGWVSGQYFLTLSEHELEKVAPKVLEKRLTELLREVFNV